jgi:DNA-binding NtrC family response regulator
LCDRIYPGTVLVFEETPKQTEPALADASLDSTEIYTRVKPTDAALIAIPAAIAAVGSAVAYVSREPRAAPKTTSREDFAASAKQTQQESRRYKRADRNTYRTERDELARDMKRAGVRVSDIAQTLGVSRSTVYRTQLI